MGVETWVFQFMTEIDWRTYFTHPKSTVGDVPHTDYAERCERGAKLSEDHE